MTKDELRARADALRWYHTIRLADGVVTRGVDNSPERLARIQLPEDLSGRSVLDVGAWDGFFSFEAERRGASRVVAADYYVWHGLGWDTGQGKAAFELARAALESSVEDVDLDVMDLSLDRIGSFDVVLFLGVLYHLQHPLLALEKVASVTKELLILETVVDMVGIDRPAAAFYPGRELSGDPTNWWRPNPAAVAGMLKTVGFRPRRDEDAVQICGVPGRSRVVTPAEGQEHAERCLSPGSCRVPRVQVRLRDRRYR